MPQRFYEAPVPLIIFSTLHAVNQNVKRRFEGGAKALRMEEKRGKSGEGNAERYQLPSPVT
jgi:hypothetical protein